MKNFVQHLSLKQLVYPNSSKSILRLNPSLLVVSKQHNTFSLYNIIRNKYKTGKISELYIYSIEKKNSEYYKEYNYNSIYEQYMNNYEEVDIGFKILDLTHLDYSFRWIKEKCNHEEDIDSICKELKDIKDYYELNSEIDGYSIIPNKYFLFKKVVNNNHY